MSDLYKFLQKAKIYIAFDNSFLTENSDFHKNLRVQPPQTTPDFPNFRVPKNHTNLDSFGVGRNPEITENQDFPDFQAPKTAKMSVVLGRPVSGTSQKSGKSRFLDGQKPVNNIGQIRKLTENYEK